MLVRDIIQVVNLFLGGFRNEDSGKCRGLQGL
jgi:hypothetical protein